VEEDFSGVDDKTEAHNTLFVPAWVSNGGVSELRVGLESRYIWRSGTERSGLEWIGLDWGNGRFYGILENFLLPSSMSDVDDCRKDVCRFYLFVYLSDRYHPSLVHSDVVGPCYAICRSITHTNRDSSAYWKTDRLCALSLLKLHVHLSAAHVLQLQDRALRRRAT